MTVDDGPPPPPLAPVWAHPYPQSIPDRVALWETCIHFVAEKTDHRCPSCGGTLRRCCKTLVGRNPHSEECTA